MSKIRIRAYASSTRPNVLWSAAQFNSAAEKNRTDCDIPLVSLEDHEAIIRQAEERAEEAVRAANFLQSEVCRLRAGCPPETNLRVTDEMVEAAMEAAEVPQEERAGVAQYFDHIIHAALTKSIEKTQQGRAS